MEDVGRYKVTRRIAEGGMAEVFEGVALGPEGFQRRVAIKRMLAENAAEPAFGRMFLDEARIASQLHHANIVAVLDYGVADGHPFQVLEFVDGVDANRLMSMGRDAGAPLPVALALAICTDIAHALEHAHTAVDGDGRSLGIVHRDVKPGNLLLSWSGDVKLGDFGIAFAKGRVETTSAGLTKGTLLYMAPEQVMRGELDGRSDVFALGCVLHAFVDGASPLARESAMADLIAGRPLAISRELPDDIYDIVVRATRLARGARYATAGEMAAALGTALARRIDRDPRSLMQEYLARLRAGVANAAGRLDALLGVNLVFSGLRRSEPPGKMAPPPALVDELEAAPAPRRVTPAFLVGFGAPILAGVVAVAVWTRSGPAPAAAMLDAASGGGHTTDAQPMIRPPPPPDGGHPIALPDAAPRPPDPLPRPRPRAPQNLPTPPVPTAPTASRSTGSGVYAIGGDGALRAEILVDGVSQGFAPRALTLEAGTHDVVLIRPDGTRVEQRIRLSAAHTESAPLRWLVP